MSLESLSDDALVACARDGNPDAFEELCVRYYDLIYRFAYRIAGTRSDAEDIVQDAFVRAAAGIRKFRGESKVQSWLYRIAMNVAYDLFAKRKREDRTAEAVKELPPEEGYDGRSEMVMKALSSLGDAERSALVLTVYDGLSHREAANILRCAETTVSWRVFRAKQKLKRMLTGVDDE